TARPRDGGRLSCSPFSSVLSWHRSQSLRNGQSGTSGSRRCRNKQVGGLMNGAKRLVRSLFLRAGLDIHRLTPASDPYAQIHAAVAANAIDIVFDVGANTGQFASALRAIGYKGRIVSFEPLS